MELEAVPALAGIVILNELEVKRSIAGPTIHRHIGRSQNTDTPRIVKTHTPRQKFSHISTAAFVRNGVVAIVGHA